MKWKLADATPQHIFLDTAFVEGLQRALGWDRIAKGREATLADLHPSLANLDHVRRLINKLQAQQYPHGTGFEGPYLICSNDVSDILCRCTASSRRTKSTPT